MSHGDDLAEAALECLRGAGDGAVTASTIRAAVGAVVSAGELHLELLGQIPASEVGRKSSRRDLVTAADVGAERRVVEQLRALGDGAAIEAEEETSDAASDGLRWFLDPLDGTVNFVHGIPNFCVSLALYRGSEPVFGVVHAPRLGETFVAASGAGSWLLEPGRAAQQLATSGASELSEAILATGFPYRRGSWPTRTSRTSDASSTTSAACADSARRRWTWPTSPPAASMASGSCTCRPSMWRRGPCW